MTNDECVKQMCSLGYSIQILAHFTEGFLNAYGSLSDFRDETDEKLTRSRNGRLKTIFDVPAGLSAVIHHVEESLERIMWTMGSPRPDRCVQC